LIGARASALNVKPRVGAAITAALMRASWVHADAGVET
jgi:hypothetical protein